MVPGVEGFMYPNEVELQWSLLIVLYPYITGLVAGAFILASLERVFKVEAVRPTYRLALLTALAFLLVAPLPLQLHLGHPERSFEMYLTPHRSSAMAMFGFVYLWYLMVVLLLEIWLEYRADIVRLAQSTTGLWRVIYRLLTLGSMNISPEARQIDDKVGYVVTVIGIPSAFLLHGYVGFIFGSIKANPWWSTPLMPVVFLFSAMVSGIAAVLVLYMAFMKFEKKPIDMPCLDTIAKYLFYTFVIDFSLEMLDLIHRTYEADESFRTLDFMVHTRLVGIAGDPPDHPGHAGAAGPSCRQSVLEVPGSPSQGDVSRGIRADPDRHLRHALERGDRGPVVLQEFPWIHHLQDGLCHARRFAAGHRADDSSVCHCGRAGQVVAPVGGKRSQRSLSVGFL